MKGLTLSRLYYEAVGEPMLDTLFPDLKKELAIGLVGEGSECLGFDDAFSQDHDFGPGFCIWLPERLNREFGAKLQDAYNALPKDFAGFYGRQATREAGQRVGVFSIEAFYSKYIYSSSYPSDAISWFKIPMHYLRTATNGEVFDDYLGTFSEIRRVLQGYYPEDVIRKKLAANCGKMAQAGQYNFKRSLDRDDIGAAFLARGIFVQAALSALFLLNRRYMPFYKWAFRDGQSFVYGADNYELLRQLSEMPLFPDDKENLKVIEAISCGTIDLLRQAGYSNETSDFLLPHAERIAQSIEDVRLKGLPLMLDFD